jgi:hypothetical protein
MTNEEQIEMGVRLTNDTIIELATSVNHGEKH